MRNNIALAWALSASAFFVPSVNASPNDPFDPPRTTLKLEKQEQQPEKPFSLPELVKDEKSTILKAYSVADKPEQGLFDLTWIPARVTASVPPKFAGKVGDKNGLIQFDQIAKDARPNFNQWVLTHAGMYERASKGNELPPAQVAMANSIFLRGTISAANKAVLDNALLDQMKVLERLRYKEDAESRENGFLAWERLMILCTLGADVRQAVPKLDKEGKPVLDAKNKPETMDLNQLVGAYPAVKLLPDWFVHNAYVLDASEFLPLLAIAWKDSRKLVWTDKFVPFIDRAATRSDAETLLKFLIVTDWKDVPEEAATKIVASLKQSPLLSAQHASIEIGNRANLAANDYTPLRTRLEGIRGDVAQTRMQLRNNQNLKRER